MKKQFGDTEITADDIFVTGVEMRGMLGYPRYFAMVQTSRNIISSYGIVETKRVNKEIEISKEEYIKYRTLFHNNK